MINLLTKYSYKILERITNDDGVRHYVCPDTQELLPSVTTILSATADHTELLEWRERVGEKKANLVRDEACALGQLMHESLENHVMGLPRKVGSNLIRKMATNMSDVIIREALKDVQEVWGMETALYAPSLYAGTADLIGTFNNTQAIMDYKTAKKMKLKSSKIVQDYAAQSAAYAFAHNYHFGTNIRMCAIFMVDRELKFEKFIFEGKEFDKALERWESRMVEYHSKN